MLNVIGYTPANRRDYVVADNHKENVLLEYTLTDGNVSDVVVSIGNGRHRHYPASVIISNIESGIEYSGIKLLPGHKLEITSPYAKYLEERAGFNKNRIYSLLVGMWDIQLLGISYTTKYDVYSDIRVPVSNVIGFRVLMARNITDLSISDMAGVLKSNFIPELSVINGDDIRIASEFIMNRFYRWHSTEATVGKHYMELVNPDDVIIVRDSRL